MSEVKYNPFGTFEWTYGEQRHHSTRHGDYHKYLGPCPTCGSVCFDYGGGWRCMNIDCGNSACNPMPNLGPRPDWWNTNVRIKKDGDQWCAHYDNFINLQESIAGFGDTPEQAVNNLKTAA